MLLGVGNSVVSRQSRHGQVVKEIMRKSPATPPNALKKSQDWKDTTPFSNSSHGEK
jgi:hypothetical protein